MLWSVEAAICGTKELANKINTSKKIIPAIAALHNIAMNSEMPAPENVLELVKEVQEYNLSEEATGRALRRRIIEQWF